MRIVPRSLTAIAVLSAFVVGACAQQEEEEDPIRILLLTKSSGFEHGVIKESEGEPGHVQTVMADLAAMHDVELTATKDAGLVNAENLKNYDIVVFYTTGDLTKPGEDGNPPMTRENLDELFAWIKGGGAFMGYHSATDTFGHHWDEEGLPFINMIGAEFRSHGSQFEGTVKVVDPGHGAMEIIPQDWAVFDEWYRFHNMNTDEIHVLALLDPGDEREKQRQYDVAPYPVIWCRQYGDGLVYYNALGHRAEVWDNPTFQQSVIEAAEWVMGLREGSTKPNYAEVVENASGEDAKSD